MKLAGALWLLPLIVGALAQQVNSPSGPIRGIAESTVSGKTYYAYYSIPYGKTPTGNLRFKAPEPRDPWTEVYDGTAEKPNICYQFYEDNDKETEDCLYMNVFTPQDPTKPSKNYPVMVNIHGGGFISGSGLLSYSSVSPKYFVEEDVIFASFNYRLGAFGFLTSGDKVIPGNAGLQDQILALKWIQRNIAAFGGDPTKVTIVGQSAGSASVGYLILSPAANGLFAGALQESGSSLSPWAYQRNQTTISYKTASFVDAQFEANRDSQKLLEVLQAADARAIDRAALAYANWDVAQPGAVGRGSLQQGVYFAPIIDSVSSDPVVPEYQYEALAKGNINKVPLLIGVCSEEGLVNLDQYIDYNLGGYDEFPGYMTPQDLHVKDWAIVGEVGQLIKEEYSPSNTFVANRLGGIQYYTDQDFAKSSIKQAELQSAFGDVYFYEFSYSGALGFNTAHKWPGSGNVSHVEEWGYLLWGQPVSGFSQEDQLVHRRLVRIWTNFAKFQNPTPAPDDLLQSITWPKVQPNNFQFVNIGNFSDPNLVIVQGKPKAERMAFWQSIYDKYGERPFDTY